MKKIMLICMLALIVVLVGCKKEEAEVVEETPVVENLVEEPSMKTIVPEPAPITVVGELDMISEAVCIDNKIQLILTNPTEEDLILAKTAQVIINGLVVVDPMCDSLEIAAGESVFCEDISGHYAIRQGKVNRVQINMKSERGISDVDCAE